MRRRIRRHRWPLIGYLVLTTFVAAGLYIADSGRQALCAQRDTLDTQIALNEGFLHPRTPKQRAQARQIFKAIPRQLIVDQQKRSIKARKNYDRLICG